MANSLLSDILHICDTHASSGMPIWPEDATSLYSEFVERRLGTKTPPIVVSVDGSDKGGGSKIFIDDPEVPWRCCTLPLPEGLTDQPHREGHAILEALKLAVQRCAEHNIDLSTRHIILRNDCVSALSAAKFGSFRSDVLQDVSLKINSIAEQNNLKLLFLHASGKALRVLLRKVLMSSHGQPSPSIKVPW